MNHIAEINISRVMTLFCFPIWLWQEAPCVNRRHALRRVSLLRSVMNKLQTCFCAKIISDLNVTLPHLETPFIEFVIKEKTFIISGRFLYTTWRILRTFVENDECYTYMKININTTRINHLWWATVTMICKVK